MVEVAPYWNVNITLVALAIAGVVVEVAPYWNVNEYKERLKQARAQVEVAPYWNVNTTSDQYGTWSMRGRSSSILECK